MFSRLSIRHPDRREDTGNSSFTAGDASPSEDLATLAKAIECVRDGQEPSPFPPEPVGAALRALFDASRARDEADLARTVGFSTQASQAMAAFSRTVVEVRSIDALTQGVS